MNPSASPNRVIYIAGYSRSGSTLLGMLLGSHPEIISTGELTFLLDDWDDSSRTCTCMERYPNCELWGGLTERPAPSPQLAKLTRRLESRWGAPRLATGSNKRSRAEYGRVHNLILNHARQARGKRIVLDSSKSARGAARRFLALSSYAEQQVDPHSSESGGDFALILEG